MAAMSNMHDYIGTITIQPELCTAKSTDIRPLLDFLLQAPKVRVHFRIQSSYGAEELDDLNDLLAATSSCTDSKWHACLRHMDHVTIALVLHGESAEQPREVHSRPDECGVA